MTIEDSRQSLLKNYAGGCWRIVPVTVEQSWQQLLNNRASDCWKLCQRRFNNRASDCWIIVQATVEQPYQRLLNNRASDCWRIIPATVQQSCQRLLNDRASYSSTSKCPRDNVCKNYQSPDNNIIFVASGRGEIIKIIKSAQLKVSQSDNSHVYKC